MPGERRRAERGDSRVRGAVNWYRFACERALSYESGGAPHLPFWFAAAQRALPAHSPLYSDLEKMIESSSSVSDSIAMSSSGMGAVPGWWPAS